MVRLATAIFGGLLLLTAGAVHAADMPPAGTWKFTIVIDSRQGPMPLTFLVTLSNSDKGWAGKIDAMSLNLNGEAKFDTVKVKEDAVEFVVKIQDAPISFDGRLTKDGKKIHGSLFFGGKTTLVDLVASRLKDFKDKFAVAKETLEQADGGADFFDAALDVLAQSAAKKMKTEDVRAIVDKAAKLAEDYGSRWQRTVSLRIASALLDQEPFVNIALEQARQAERMLKSTDDASTQMEVLQALAETLRKAKKADELRPVEGRITKLEARDFAEYSKKLPFKPEEFKGRKSKSDRAVLVELFTGAECPPCVGCDIAFDAILSTYKPTEVVGLEYHLHVPLPDPLTNKEGMERAERYRGRDLVTPMVFFNGKMDNSGGARMSQAKSKYSAYCEMIDDLLEKPSGAKLQLSASQKGTDINIKAAVNELAKPGEKVMLRFVLAEERVRYPGGNGIRYHHCVVRAFPGGVKGVPLTKMQSEHTATINLDKVRAEISKYLDEFAKSDEFPNSERPMALKNLRVVAFIQDDATGEVLQSAEVEVEEKKGE